MGMVSKTSLQCILHWRYLSVYYELNKDNGFTNGTIYSIFELLNNTRILGLLYGPGYHVLIINVANCSMVKYIALHKI